MAPKYYSIPHPIIDRREEKFLVLLTERYNKLLEPGIIEKAGAQISGIIPKKVKEIGSGVKSTVTEQELYTQCMKIVAEGFSALEKKAVKNSLGEREIVERVNRVTSDNKITSIKEVCLARCYAIACEVSTYKSKDQRLAFAEGGVTGCFGFVGMPFNLVLSTFLYYRAVQSVAMFYGYDTKKDMAELVIAGEVFMCALNPKNADGDGVSSIIREVMRINKMPLVHDEMASKLNQMRVLASGSAGKSAEVAGKKGLENILFKEIFEQIGKKLAKKVLGKAIPVAGAVIGGMLDAAQMKAVLEYADIFYQKRFILEKEDRINQLINVSETAKEVM